MQPIRSIGIIMDGNRRWAKAKNLPAFEGHRAGFEALKKLANDFPRLREKYGLEYVTLYAFSAENWNRSPEEVSFLMKLFEEGVRMLLRSLTRSGQQKSVRVRFIGDRSRLPETLQKLMQEAEEKSEQFSGNGTIVFALSYGGRQEILEAVRRIILEKKKEISEDLFTEHLGTTGIPDPDLVIRTSGEKRLSNFLPWQSVYSELFFTDTLWPDFSLNELEDIFAEFQNRERRHGK